MGGEVQRITIGIVLALLATGCATGLVSKARKLGEGSTLADVETKLGEPVRKATYESDEVWQYCSTGAVLNSYANVWIRDQVVRTVLTESRFDLKGECKLNLHDIASTETPPPSKPPHHERPKTLAHGVPTN
jgi:hypothetical protein